MIAKERLRKKLKDNNYSDEIIDLVMHLPLGGCPFPNCTVCERTEDDMIELLQSVRLENAS